MTTRKTKSRVYGSLRRAVKDYEKNDPYKTKLVKRKKKTTVDRIAAIERLLARQLGSIDRLADLMRHYQATIDKIAVSWLWFNRGPEMIYAIVHSQTGRYLPTNYNHSGAVEVTLDDPRKPPRLFSTLGHARRALDCWLKVNPEFKGEMEVIPVTIEEELET